ncbi:Rha family transcriptional regulator [Pseudomonas sp. NA-150]|uniref:Rha family transcriptional regulator n=1 Tax=Pseudomonas sp. NA-150 TaxID=3367525 RepID=UPI0037CC0FBE
MNTNTVVDMRKFVEARNGEAFTNTQNVAEAFGKLHKDVLRKVDGLECSTEFTERNFTLSSYIDGSGRSLPQWTMTKDGFMFLVMGFTGKKAAAIKEGYIAAFNWMADQLGLSSKTLVAKAVEAALGSDGAQIISNILRCRVAKLDAEHQRSAVMKMSSALHARFGVPRIELIPASQMDAACNFVASYAIEGEYLPKQEEGGLHFSRSEVGAIYSMMSHVSYLLRFGASIHSAASTLNSRPMMDVADHIDGSRIPFVALDKRRKEIYRMYSSGGCEGGYAMAGSKAVAA